MRSCRHDRPPYPYARGEGGYGIERGPRENALLGRVASRRATPATATTRAGEPFNYLLTGRQSPLSILYLASPPPDINYRRSRKQVTLLIMCNARYSRGSHVNHASYSSKFSMYLYMYFSLIHLSPSGKFRIDCRIDSLMTMLERGGGRNVPLEME